MLIKHSCSCGAEYINTLHA